MHRILVLGGTSAIAQGAMKVWAKRGETIFFVARDAAKAEVVAADLRTRGAKEVAYIAAELAAVENHQAIVQRAVSFLGKIDTVLIAYGVHGNHDLAVTNFDETKRILDVNLCSPISFLTILSNLMIESNGGGTLAVISSVAGDRGRQSNYIYGTSKGALNVFLQGLRNRLFRHGINVLTIKPGFVDTPMTAHLAKKGPLFAKPEDVGAKIVSAIDRRANEVYVPGFWRFIMLVILHIPECVFKRLKL